MQPDGTAGPQDLIVIVGALLGRPLTSKADGLTTLKGGIQMRIPQPRLGYIKIVG